METFLRGERIELRQLEPDDRDRCLAWINDPDVRQYLTICKPVGSIAEEEWIRALPHDKGSIVFAAMLRSGSRHIGNVGLHRIDWVNRNAEMGCFIGSPDHRGKGVGREMGAMVIAYAFRELNLHKVWAYAYAFNRASLACMERLGFQREGTQRQHVFKDGAYHDVAVMGLLRSEWQPASD